MATRQDKPVINNVLGESGTVPNGGTTQDTELVVAGVARGNAHLDIYDGVQKIDFVQAEELGDWAKSLHSLAGGYHELTAHTADNDFVSDPWTFTIVAELEQPDITHVQDSAGRPIANNGATEDTIVTLFGHAKEPMVEVLDETRSWGTAQVASNETWNKRLAGLEVGRHEFTAKHMVNEQVSLPWSFTVISSVSPPEILRVRDSVGNDIANGGITEDTEISLSGTAKENSTVEVLDEDTSWGTTQAALSGSWVKTLAGLDVGLHLFMAKEVVSQLESNRWAFTVQAEDPLVIDTSPMRLDGFSIYMAWPRTDNDSPGNTGVRRPTGGSPPYSYSSSNTAIAQVDSNGKVRGVGWGDAVISVTDQKSNAVSFTVMVTNVYQVTYFPRLCTHPEAVATFNSLTGAEVFDQRAFDELVRLYRKPFPDLQSHYWCPVPSGCGGGLGLSFLYPQQYLGCADPNLEYFFLVMLKTPQNLSDEQAKEFAMPSLPQAR